MEETKKCPYCGGEILAVAKKCKHCGEWLIEREKLVSEPKPKPVEEKPQVKEVNTKKTTKRIWIGCVAILLLIVAPIVYYYWSEANTDAMYDRTEDYIKQNLGKNVEEYKQEKAEEDRQAAEEAARKAKEQQEKEAQIEKVVSELSGKHTVVGPANDYVFYLKGRKGKYEPKLYSQSIYGSSESSNSLEQFYDGSMEIQDFAICSGNVVLIVNETDRNSTGFLVSTLVLSLNASTNEWKDLSDGGCVKAEFIDDKTKVKMTYGEIINPDAEYTLDYKYKYSTKEVAL